MWQSQDGSLAYALEPRADVSARAARASASRCRVRRRSRHEEAGDMRRERVAAITPTPAMAWGGAAPRDACRASGIACAMV